jgi:predicted transcriptional regulator of viral defense system
MPRRSPRNSLRALTALAATQGGYFTAKQAGRFGYRPPHLSYHAAHGNIERAGHGLYRMPTLPTSAHDDLTRLWLWSRARNDRPQAVVSHQTALALHELAEAVPDIIHLTVPLGFRKRTPRGCRLHQAPVARQHTQAFDAVPVTTPLRTLQDLATDPTLPAEQFVRAAHAASRRGMIIRRELHALLAQRRAVRAARTRRRRSA